MIDKTQRQDPKVRGIVWCLSCALALVFVTSPAAANPDRTSLTYDERARAERDYTAIRQAARAGDILRVYELLTRPSAESLEMVEGETASQAETVEIGAIVLRLLSEGQGFMEEYPDLTALLLSLAEQNWDKLNPAEQEQALSQILHIITKAQDPAFQKEHPQAASEIITQIPKLQEKLPPALAERLNNAVETAALQNPVTTPPQDTVPLNSASPN